MRELITQIRLSLGLWLLCFAVQKIMPSGNSDTEVWRDAVREAATKLHERGPDYYKVTKITR